MNQIYAAENQFNKEIGIINGYMRKKKVSLELAIKIQKYLEYIWQKERNANFLEEKCVIDKLSNNLKKELKQEAFGKYLQKIPFLSKNFSNGFLEKLTYCINEISQPPYEYILNEKDSDNNLYIVRSGEIELSVPMKNNCNKVIRTLKHGDYFNEENFFTHQRNLINAMSTCYSSIYTISFQNFSNIIKSFPEDYEKYCEIRDNIILYKNYKEVHIRCFSCNDNHSLLNCNFLHYYPLKEHIIHKQNYSKPHLKRQIHTRRFKKNLNCLKNFVKIDEEKIENYSNYYYLNKRKKKSTYSIDHSCESISEFDQNIKKLYSNANSPVLKTNFFSENSPFSSKIKTSTIRYESLNNEHLGEEIKIINFQNPENENENYQMVKRFPEKKTIMDIKKSFNNYFIKNNSENVLKNINILNLQKSARRKKRFKISIINLKIIRPLIKKKKLFFKFLRKIVKRASSQNKTKDEFNEIGTSLFKKFK